MRSPWAKLKRSILILGGTLPIFLAFQNCGRNPDLVGQALHSQLSLSSTNGLCRRTSVLNGSEASVDRLATEKPRLSIFEASGRKVLLNEVNLETHSPQNRSLPGLPAQELKAGERLSVLVDRRCQVETAARSSLASRVAREARESENLPDSGRWNITWELQDPLLVEELSLQAEQDPCIVGINREVVHKTTAVPTDPQYANQAFLNTLAAATAWDVFYHRQTGIQTPVVIGIIDTGLQLNHPDLQPNLWNNPDEVAGNNADDDRNGFVDDLNGWDFVSMVNMGPLGASEIHSTHVAGLAAARTTFSGDPSAPTGVSGVMGQQVRIMALDVFQGDGATNAVIANAIRYAALEGATVINMSLGAASIPTADIIDAIDFALSRGTFVVAAAGNDGCAIVHQDGTVNTSCTRDGQPLANVFSPGSLVRDGMITVAALHETTEALCSFSNRNLTSAQGAQIGQAIQIAAPGCGSVAGSFRTPPATGLLSTFSSPPSSYNRISGTSMASPVVAGAVGLIHGLYKSRTGATPSPALVERILLEGSIPVSGTLGAQIGGRKLNMLTLASYMDVTFPQGSPGVPGDGNPRPCP